jgi:PAS domain S-box-containing protein
MVLPNQIQEKWMVEIESQENPPIVLLADDDEMMRILIRTSLEQSGFWVEEVEDGASALKLFKSLLPDVVLLDVMMPGVNGFDVCKEIRKLPEAIFTPILMITGLSDIKSIERAYELGATDFITKPVNWGTLGHHVRYLLRSGKTAEQLHKSKEALRISEERYALAAKGANDGLWDWDLHTGNIYFSERWQSILGYDYGTFGNTLQDWFEHIHKDDLQYVEITLSNHLEGLTEHFEHEHRMHHKDQEYRWVLVRGLAIRDADGKPYRMAGSLTDITRRKKSEEQLIHNALYDTLTGLANRTLFSNRLSHAMQRLKRKQDSTFLRFFSWIWIVLRSLMTALDIRSVTKYSKLLPIVWNCAFDRVIRLPRLGGDEFVILLEGIQDIGDAEKWSREFKPKFNEPIQLQHHQVVHTSASIGIVMGSPTYDRPEEILRDADTAMYRAKSMGGVGTKFLILPCTTMYCLNCILKMI